MWLLPPASAGLLASLPTGWDGRDGASSAACMLRTMHCQDSIVEVDSLRIRQHNSLTVSDTSGGPGLISGGAVGALLDVEHPEVVELGLQDTW